MGFCCKIQQNSRLRSAMEWPVRAIFENSRIIFRYTDNSSELCRSNLNGRCAHAEVLQILKIMSTEMTKVPEKDPMGRTFAGE